MVYTGLLAHTSTCRHDIGSRINIVFIRLNLYIERVITGSDNHLREETEDAYNLRLLRRP